MTKQKPKTKETDVACVGLETKGYRVEKGEKIDKSKFQRSTLAHWLACGKMKVEKES